MDSIAQLEREKRRLIAQKQVKSDFAKNNEKRRKLRKEIRELKYGEHIAKGRRVKKGVVTVAKQTGRGFKRGGKIAKKLASNLGESVAAEYGRPQKIPGVNPKKKRKFEPFY